MGAPKASLLFGSGPPDDEGPAGGVRDDEQHRQAMHRAGRLLAARSRSEHEMRSRLEAAGFDRTVVADVLERLLELRLLDDLAFARQWVAERSGARGPRMLTRELRDKGVDSETIEAALHEAGPREFEAAKSLAASRLGALASRPLPDQARRLQALLLRRGFSFDVVEDAVRAVLPPEGWD